MNKKILNCFVLVLAIFVSFQVKGQTDNPSPIPAEEKSLVVDSITSQYYDWEKLSISGKLSSSVLPVSPSIKIYMEKDKMVLISIAAPLVGEVARIEVDREKALIVNKFANTFTTMLMEEIEPMCPGGLQALQNLFLGRINILGEGELSKKNEKDIEIYNSGVSRWLVLPNQDLENAEYVYYYTVTRASGLLDRFVVETDGAQAGCIYGWNAKNTTIEFDARLGSHTLGGTLKLNLPDDSAKPMNRLELGSKYKEVSPYQILRLH